MSETSIEEDFLRTVARVNQTLHMTLARGVEHLARQRENDRRQAEQHSLRAAQEHQARTRAEWASDRVMLQRVHQDQWWDSARGEDIANAYMRAGAWQSYAPEAAQAMERIQQQVQERYGVDLTNADAVTHEDLIKTVNNAREHGRDDRTRSSEEARASDAMSRDDDQAGSKQQGSRSASAADAMSRADDQGRTKQESSRSAPANAEAPGPEAKDSTKWDSRERRADLREHLADRADASTVDAVVLTDLGHASPTDSVAPAQHLPKARVNHSREVAVERGVQGPAL